jgi:hypothetical protein
LSQLVQECLREVGLVHPPGRARHAYPGLVVLSQQLSFGSALWHGAKVTEQAHPGGVAEWSKAAVLKEPMLECATLPASANTGDSPDVVAGDGAVECNSGARRPECGKPANVPAVSLTAIADALDVAAHDAQHISGVSWLSHVLDALDAGHVAAARLLLTELLRALQGRGR